MFVTECSKQHHSCANWLGNVEITLSYGHEISSLTVAFNTEFHLRLKQPLKTILAESLTNRLMFLLNMYTVMTYRKIILFKPKKFF